MNELVNYIQEVVLKVIPSPTAIRYPDLCSHDNAKSLRRKIIDKDILHLYFL